ncbi:MAG: hypothetical protein AAF434_11055 [Pseudomonadota bacterium]
MTAAMQKSADLYFILPGLFECPHSSLDCLQNSSLVNLMRGARPQAVEQQSYEAVLGCAFDCASGLHGCPPIASAQAERIGVRSNVVRADPVHLKVDRDSARLIDADALDISVEESTALRETLNSHLQADGLHVHECNACEWLLAGEGVPTVDMGPPSYAYGRNIDRFIVEAGMANEGKQLLTEIQMLLHSHPVNQDRMMNGKLSVNSLWVWGAGDLPQSDRLYTPLQVASDDPLTRELATYLGLAIVDDFEQMAIDSRTVIADRAMFRPAVDNSASEWERELERIDNKYAKKIHRALKIGTVKSVIIAPCDGREFHLQRISPFKFWQPKFNVREFIAPQKDIA